MEAVPRSPKVGTTAPAPCFATVGLYLRVEPGREETVRLELEELAGVETFELGGNGKLGALIEAEDLDAAHSVLVQRVQPTAGVLAAWPVFAHFEDVPDERTELPPDDGRGGDEHGDDTP